jgi:hypothetical protein
VDLHFEPVVLQVNGSKLGSKNGAKSVNQTSASVGIIPWKNGHTDDLAEAKTEEPV